MNNIFNAEYYNHLSRIKDIMPEAGRSLSLQYETDFWIGWVIAFGYELEFVAKPVLGTGFC